MCRLYAEVGAYLEEATSAGNQALPSGSSSHPEGDVPAITHDSQSASRSGGELQCVRILTGTLCNCSCDEVGRGLRDNLDASVGTTQTAGKMDYSAHTEALGKQDVSAAIATLHQYFDHGGTQLRLL